MRKLKIVISDFHLARGRWLPNGRRNPLEDFHQDERLEELLDHYSSGAYATWEIELVVNGDFFDPLAVIPLPEERGKFPKLEYPLEVEESAAVAKFRQIVEGHPVAFNALRRFLARGKRVVFRWGNHDAAILWPGVQAYLRTALEAPEPGQIEVQMDPYIFDRICIDHGHQHEIINQFDTKKMFFETETPRGRRTIQNLPFGSFFVMGFINRLKLERSFINQVYPLHTYLRIWALLEPFRFLRMAAIVSWFFIKMRFVTHPYRFARLKKTLLILTEMFYRPSLEEVAEEILTGPGSADLPYDVLIMGHNHQAASRVFPGGKQYINTGCWTPITSLDMSNLGHRVMRTYAVVEYVDGRARASLKIWHGQARVTDEFA